MKNIRRYIVEIDEEKGTIESYQTLPEAALERGKLEFDYHEPGERILAAWWITSMMQLVPAPKE